MALAWIRLVAFAVLSVAFLGTGVAMWLYDVQRGRETAGPGYLLVPVLFFWFAIRAGRDVRRRSRY